MTKIAEEIGIVVIGRNEGERLKKCLYAVCNNTGRVVYVDSGSIDGSVEFAKSLAVEVVSLDISYPFTMARARNTGFKRLIKIAPDTNLVQFVDGDSELLPGYLEAAALFLQKHDGVAIVVGRCIERFPEATIFNRLCDIEWSKEIGEIKSCGGSMMVRSKAFLSAGMFNDGMIAGEEPELCLRIRNQGGKIYRIDCDMVLHDAAIFKLSQWWYRAVRGGHAFAEGAAIHWKSKESHKVREVLSAFFWGAVIPGFIVGCFVLSAWWPWAITGVALGCFSYAALAFKINNLMRSKGYNSFDARLYAIFCVVAKAPIMIGICKYWVNRILGKTSRIIEYKH